MKLFVTTVAVLFAAVVKVKSTQVEFYPPEGSKKACAVLDGQPAPPFVYEELVQEMKEGNLYLNKTGTGKLVMCYAKQAGVVDAEGALSVLRLVPLMAKKMEEHKDVLKRVCPVENGNVNAEKVASSYPQCLQTVAEIAFSVFTSGFA